MDPISAAASAITIIAAGHTGWRFISALRQAPAELIALQNLRSNVGLILREVSELDKECDILRRDRQALSEAIAQTQSTIQALDSFVGRIEAQAKSKNAPHLWRVKWGAKYKKRAEQLARDLDTVCKNLTAILSLRNLKKVHEIAEEVSEYTTVHTQTLKNLAERQTTDSQTITSKLQKLETDFEDFSSRSHTNQLLLDQEISRVQKYLIRYDKMLQIIYEDIHQGQVQKASITAAVVPKAYVRTSLSKSAGKKCPKSCNCKCHMEAMLSTPEQIGGIFGYVFGGYQGLRSTMSCSIPSCSSIRSTSIKATWILPSWLATKVASIAISKAESCSLNVRLKTRVYSRDDSLHRCMEQGDLPAIRQIIRERKTSLDEVATGYGETALVWSINRSKLDACEFLLNQKADPTLEDFSGRSVRCVALMKIIRETRSNTKDSLARAERLKSLFWDDTAFEELDFSPLHEIVLGLKQGDLSNEVADTETDINHQDRTGRTALYWAAAGNDVDTMKILLDNGADADLVDGHGSTALSAASVIRGEATPAAMNLLLSYKASVQPARQTGFTPLLHAAYHKNDVAFIEPLLIAGCEVDQKEVRGRSSLARTALADQDKTAELLIKYGANINSVDNYGYSVMAIAIQSGANKVLRLLLAQRADYRQVNRRRQNILHIAAISSRTNVETLRILHRVGLHGIDVNSVDEAGCTAIEYLNQRQDCSPDFKEMYWTLIQYMQPSRETWPSTHNDDELDQMLTLAMS